jgi:hypothetical protein
MSWSPTDLVSDLDLEAYEKSIRQDFGAVTFTEKRQAALEHWLWPRLAQAKFPAERFRTRYHPDAVYTSISSAWGDETGDAKSQTVDDLDLAAIFATPGTDALYIGSTKMFRGLSVRLADAVSAVTSTLTVSLWVDGWQSVAITDGTSKTAGKTFSGGGAVTWRVPDGWVVRSVNSSTPLYWAKLTVSATPTAATAGQLAVIRRSLLAGPATYRTLCLIMREAPTQQDGPWMPKAEWYETQADRTLDLVIPSLGGEFDTLIEDDVVSEAETAQSTREVTQGGWSLERG